LNIPPGVTTIQDAGRPTINGAFIAETVGIGNDFFSVSAR